MGSASAGGSGVAVVTPSSLLPWRSGGSGVSAVIASSSSADRAGSAVLAVTLWNRSAPAPGWMSVAPSSTPPG
jgi:hypothetical protein